MMFSFENSVLYIDVCGSIVSLYLEVKHMTFWEL